MRIINVSYIIVVTTLLTFTHCIGQEKTNNISCNEYERISFNGATIKQLNASEGVPQKVQQVLGSYSTMEESDTFWKRTFKYGDNSILFNYERGNVNGHVTNLTIINYQWPVKIKGHTIRVGDSVADLKQAFGYDLIVVDSQFSSKKYVFFGCENTGSEGVNILIDPNTNKVIEISYTVFT